MAGNSVRFTATIDDKVSAKLGIIGTKFDKTFGKNSSAVLFGSLGAKAVAGGFSLISGAVGGLTDALGGAINAAIDDAAEQKNLQNALDNNIPGWKYNIDKVNEYIDAQGRRGFTDTEVRASLAQLVGITHDATAAQDLNTIAQDLAAAKGIDLATATDVVGKAALGNGKALKGYGIDIGKAKDAATILDIVQGNVKGSADTMADTMQGKMKAANIGFSEAMEKIGYTLMPVVSDLMQKFANDWLPALGRGWDKVRPYILNVAGAIGAVVGAIKHVIGWIGDMLGALGRGIDKINKFLGSLGKLPEYAPGSHYNLPGPGVGKGKAEGGWVGLNGPELVLTGEKGPEYITPNSRLGGGGGTGVTIVGVSEREIVDMVERGLFFRLRLAAPTQGRV